MMNGLIKNDLMKSYISLFLILFSTISFGQIINDESYLDIDFVKFKNELLNTVIEKDTTRLKTFLADNVFESNDTCGYPGCSKDELIAYYFKDNSDENWNELLTILRFGFSRIEDENSERIVPHDKLIFQGPSYLKKLDRDNELLVLGEKVNIRNKPGLKAKVIRSASYEVFKCDCNILTMTPETYQEVDGIYWIEVKLPENKVGFIAASLTSYDYIKELTVAKINQWRMENHFLL